MHRSRRRSRRHAVLPLLLALAPLATLPARAAAAEAPSSCGGVDFASANIAAEPGVELFARAGGRGPAVIVPGDFLLYEALCPLAATHRMVFYDMRNRGRSSPVADGALLTIEADVRDLEAVRRHFGLERAALVGYSYLGKMVVLHALEHPERVERLVQLGAVPMDPARAFPPELAASWDPPAEEIAALRALRAEGLHERDPEAYCEAEWAVLRASLVGDPANASRLRSRCGLPNEHPTRLAFHLEHHFRGSAIHAVVTPAQAARVTAPVLTVHGTLDRNAPYGGGREWAGALPEARLLTLEGAAHAAFAERDLLPALARFLDGGWPEGTEAVEPAGEGQLSQLQAFDLLRAARDHHRPEPAPAGRHLVLELAGELYPRSQGLRPEPPFVPFPIRETVTVDPAAARLEIVEEITWPEFVARFRTVADGGEGFEVDLVQGREVPPFLPPGELRARNVRRLPPLLLAEVLLAAPGSLRFAGVERRGGEWLTVVSALHDGERLDLRLAEDGRLTAVGRMVDEPMYGDAYELLRFEGEARAGAWRLPARVVREVSGLGTTSEIAVESASWTPADEAAFARPPRPDGAEAEASGSGAAPGGPAAPGSDGGPAAEAVPAGPATTGTGAAETVELESLAPHAWRAPMPGSPDYASLVLERADHLVLVEAPVGERPVERLRAALAERFPGKPLRWLVATHHHFDHSGGVPAALEEGTTLVTTPGNAAFFRRAVRGLGTLSGREELRPEPALETVADRLALPGGPPAVVVLRVPPHVHAEEMLAVWLPEPRILFQADLVRFPLDDEGSVRPQTRALLELIDAGRLPVERIVGVHGEEGTPEELRAALGEAGP